MAWNREKALDLLTRNEEKEKVEALCLKLNHLRQHRFTSKDFVRLPNLKFLEVEGARPMGEAMENVFALARLFWRYFSSNVLPTNDFREKSILLPKLRWLSMNNLLPLLDLGSFPLANLSVLDLSCSGITHTWKGWSQIKMAKNLKVLNLTGSCYLKKTPNVSAHANLERLLLKECWNLVKIGESIGQLKRLVSGDVRYCLELRRLSDELGELKALKELLLDLTSIKGIPEIRGMKNLRIISACGCDEITQLPLSIGDLASLEYLYLREGKSLERLSNSIGKLESLMELDISRTGIKELPDSLWTMEKLEAIRGEFNRRLRVKIPNDTYRISSLRILKPTYVRIHAIPRLPKSLIRIELSKLHMKMLPDLSDLINLRELNVGFCEGARPPKLVEDPMPWWIGRLIELESFRLFSEVVFTLTADIGLLSRLETLELRCPNLRYLPRLPTSLSSFLQNCMSIHAIDLSNLQINYRNSLLHWLQSLRFKASIVWTSFNLCRLFSLNVGRVLPDLSNSKQLRKLHIGKCKCLVEIQGEMPASMQLLTVEKCKSSEKLPDLSSLEGPEEVEIYACVKLNAEVIPGYAENVTKHTKEIEGEAFVGLCSLFIRDRNCELFHPTTNVFLFLSAIILFRQT